MNQIAFQMSEFQSSILTIEQKFNLIHRTIKETLNDLNSGFQFLNNSLVGNKDINSEELTEYKNKIQESVLNECESMKNTLKELVSITNNCKDFQETELLVRKKFNEDPDNFNEKNLKDLIHSKSTNREINHPKYLEVLELLENAKNGDLVGTGDDIVMDATSQVTRCPITSKPIEDAVKNTLCDHVYERSAIMHYLKTNRHKKCPFAGCKQHVSIK